MKLFSPLLLLLVLVTSVLAVFEMRSNPPPLFPNSLCRDFTTVFTQFGSRCILATQFIGPSTPTTVHLQAFDINCNLIGDSASVSTKNGFDFHTQLPYILVIDRYQNMTPPSFWYAGVGWGSDIRECWVDEDDRYVCSQIFQC